MHVCTVWRKILTVENIDESGLGKFWQAKNWWMPMCSFYHYWSWLSSLLRVHRFISYQHTCKPMHMLRCDTTYPSLCSHISCGYPKRCGWFLQCNMQMHVHTSVKDFLLCSYSIDTYVAMHIYIDGWDTHIGKVL